MIFHIIHNLLLKITLPLYRLHSTVALAFYALLVGFLIVLLYKKISNQDRITAIKDQIKAHLLEVRIYRDDVRNILSAFFQILRYNVFYLFHTLRSLVILMVPIVLLVFHLASFYDHRPFLIGEDFLLSAEYRADLDPKQIILDGSPALDVETPPLRLLEERLVFWRCKVKEAGEHTLSIILGEEKVEKKILCQTSIAPLATHRLSSNDLANVLHPSDPPLPKDTFLSAIHLDYPRRHGRFFGLSMHWLLFFFILSVLSGLVSKKIFKVVM